MEKNCIICGSDDRKMVFEEESIPIYRCLRCGHLCSSFRREADYAGYFGTTDLTKDDYFWFNKAHVAMYGDFCRRFIGGRKGRLLDVGCGLGYFIKKISEFSDWQATGYEISAPAAKFASEKLGLNDVFCGRVEDSGLPDGSFDIITLWDVIEHLSEPDRLLSRSQALLSENGFLFIHTPNASVQLLKAKIKKTFLGMKQDIHYLEAKDHLNIYSVRSMIAILKKNGFNRIEFIHLSPIQGVAGKNDALGRFLKNLWFYSAFAIAKISGGRINYDNLFVIARR